MLRLNVVWSLQNFLGSGNLKKLHWNFSTKHMNFNYKMQLLRPLRKNLENPKNTSYVLVAFHHFNYCLDCIKCVFFCVVFFLIFWKGGGGNVIHARLFWSLECIALSLCVEYSDDTNDAIIITWVYRSLIVCRLFWWYK